MNLKDLTKTKQWDANTASAGGSHSCTGVCEQQIHRADSTDHEGRGNADGDGHALRAGHLDVQSGNINSNVGAGNAFGKGSENCCGSDHWDYAQDVEEYVGEYYTIEDV